MNCLPARKVRLFRFCALFLALSSLTIGASSGQSGDRTNDDEVRLVIVLARHGVRAPIESEIRSSIYNTEPWPSWPVQPGVLTTHGAEALRLLGGYYRARYARLLPHTPCESSGIYAEANSTQRTIASAHAFMMGLRPDCEIKVHFLAESEGRENPLYLPALNDLTDRQRLAAAIDGRMNGRPDWFTDAFSATLSEMQRVLSGCDGQRCDRDRVDLQASQEQVRVPAGPGLVDVDGPVSLGADFAENFLLEYAEGMPMSSVGWGRVSRDDLNQLMEMNTRYHDFLLRTPYFAQIGGSEMAARIRDTLDSAATKGAVENPFRTPQDRFILLMGHDSNLAWLGGLLRLDWLVEDQTFNATPPGSALVFELHHNRVSGNNRVQVFFVSQTLNEIRRLSLLEGSEQPSVAPVFVPGCSGPAPAFACALEDFDNVVTSAIDKRFIANRTK